MSGPLIHTLTELRGGVPVTPVVLPSGLVALPVVDLNRQPQQDELQQRHAFAGLHLAGLGAGEFPALELRPGDLPAVVEEIRLERAGPADTTWRWLLPGINFNAPSLADLVAIELGATPGATAAAGTAGAPGFANGIYTETGVFTFGAGWLIRPDAPMRIVANAGGGSFTANVRWREPAIGVDQSGGF